jgi:hypothetical protein
MFRPDSSEFTVDLITRRVSHSSGAVVVFRAYEAEEDWHKPGGVTIENGHLFRGLESELIEGARQAARAAGMGHKAPEHYAALQERLMRLAGPLGFSLDRTADGRLLITVHEQEIGAGLPPVTRSC